MLLVPSINELCRQKGRSKCMVVGYVSSTMFYNRAIIENNTISVCLDNLAVSVINL